MAGELPVIDGGDLDCGSGLLLMIRKGMAELPAGASIEIRSREPSVAEDLPAWCRMVGHTLLETLPADDGYTCFRVRKKGGDSELAGDLQSARDYRWRARLRWEEGMRGRLFCRNHSFDVGQPLSFDTQDAAPSALEYLLGALGGCLGVGFAWRLRRAGIEVANLELSLAAQPENVLVFLGIEEQGSPGLQSIEGTLYVDAPGADDARIDEIWLETLRRSPVANSLLHGCRLNIRCARV